MRMDNVVGEVREITIDALSRFDFCSISELILPVVTIIGLLSLMLLIKQ